MFALHRKCILSERAVSGGKVFDVRRAAKGTFKASTGPIVCAEQGLDFHVGFSPTAGEKLCDARAARGLSASDPCSDQINCEKKLREYCGFCLVSGHCSSDTK